MKVTKVDIRPVDDGTALKGFVTVVLNDCLAIHDIRIVHGNSGLFLAFPNKEKAPGKWYDTIHPITQDCRQMITDAVLSEYNKLV